MKNITKSLLIAAMFLLSGATFAAAGNGTDYVLLNQEQPKIGAKKIEVLEFFFYGCPHCYHLHGPLSNWEKSKPKDVELRYVPASSFDNGEQIARAFFALESMGQIDKLHDKFYKAWQEINLFSESEITSFVVQQGVDGTTFKTAFHSDAVNQKMEKNFLMLINYGVVPRSLMLHDGSGTPSLVVNGKYRIINKASPEETIRSLNAVIEMVRKERSAGKH